MSKNIHKTNAARELDRLNIAYELLEYKVDESDLSAFHVANSMNENIANIYKTIVCNDGNGGYLVACLRGDAELDLKALASAANTKKRCSLLNLKDLEKITGYIRGGCSPLAMKKRFSTFIDIMARENEYVIISAGIRGKQIKLTPSDLILATNAKWANIARFD